MEVCWRKYVLKIYFFFFFIKEAIRSFRKKDALSSKNAEKHRPVNRALEDGKSHNCYVIDTKVQFKYITTAITENHTAGMSTLA